jgi:hypothetical protein
MAKLFTNPNLPRPEVGPHNAPATTQPQDRMPGSTGEKIPNQQRTGSTAQAPPTPEDAHD